MRQQFTSRGFAICLSLACLFLTGNVLAEGVTATTIVPLGDCSPGMPGRVINIPANSVTRAMGVLRVGGGTGDFFLRVILGGNAQFATGGLPVAGDLTQTGGSPAANVAIRLVIGGMDGETFVEFIVEINADFTFFPTFTLDTSGWKIRDVDNLLAVGGIITITLATLDGGSRMEIDLGVDTVNWLMIAGDSCPFPRNCAEISELIELSVAGALRSEEMMVARLERVLRRAETIAEIRPRDANSMLADLAEASFAIAAVSDGLDLAEAFECLADGELLLIRPDILTASALDNYVGVRLEDPFSEVTPQTLLNLMGRAIEHKENVMETLISFGFFLIE